MSGRVTAMTARKVPCPTCGAPRFEYCTDGDRVRERRSHPARVEAAKQAPDMTSGRLEMLRKLHADPTRHIELAMRIGLLKRGLIVALDPPRAPHAHLRTRPPKRRHPLTAAGRAAIGVLTEVDADHGL